MLLLVSAIPVQAQTVDSKWIMQKLARPAPMRTPFVEVRDSPLLKAPLRLIGEYRRPREDTLVREVHAPYVETTTIRDGEVSIVRKGASARRFSLSRAPELISLQSSFGAMLAGDHRQLERGYRIVTTGTTTRWVMTLTPKEATLAARVREITLYGQGAELRCIETQPVRGERQRTLLASAARTVTAGTDAKTLVLLCRNGVKSG